MMVGEKWLHGQEGPSQFLGYNSCTFLACVLQIVYILFYFKVEDMKALSYFCQVSLRGC